MAKQDINYGSEVGDPTAESVFDSFKKSKENFDELYDDLSTAEGEIDALQSDVDDLKVLAENNETDSYILALTDANKIVTITNENAVTLTVPLNSSVAFPVNTTIMIAQLGAGQVTITPATVGVTIHSYDSALKIVGQYASCSLIKLATDTWLCVGNLEA